MSEKREAGRVPVPRNHRDKRGGKSNGWALLQFDRVGVLGVGESHATRKAGVLERIIRGCSVINI